MPHLTLLVISIIIIIICVCILWVYKQEDYTYSIRPCKVSDIVKTYNDVISKTSNADTESIDSQTVLEYNKALDNIKALYSKIPECSLFNTDNLEYNVEKGAFICLLDKPGSVCKEKLLHTQHITKSGTYSIPYNVTSMKITLVGGGAGPTFVYNGLPGSTITKTVPVYNISTFTAVIGKGGACNADITTLNQLTNLSLGGGDTSITIGKYTETVKGGSMVKKAITPGQFRENYSSAYRTGYNYGDGGNCNGCIPGKDGGIIVDYVYADYVQTIGKDGYVDMTFESPVANFPVPVGTKKVRILAVGGGGGGWKGGVVNSLPLPAGYPTYDVGYIDGNPNPIYYSKILYGEGGGAGGGSGEHIVTEFDIVPYPADLLVQYPKLTSTISINWIGAGGNGADGSNPAGNGGKTWYTFSTYRNTQQIFVEGGNAATGLITPGKGGMNSFGLASYDRTFQASGPGMNGTTFAARDPNGVIKYTVPNTPALQNFFPHQGTNGGSTSFNDSMFRPINTVADSTSPNTVFGLVNEPVDDYFDPNGLVRLKDAKRGCGGRGGDAYIYLKDGKDKLADLSKLTGSPGGRGGDGYVRVIFY